MTGSWVGGLPGYDVCDLVEYVMCRSVVYMMVCGQVLLGGLKSGHVRKNLTQNGEPQR